VGHFCLSLFPLFGVYAAVPAATSAACPAAVLGVGGVGVGDCNGTGDERGNAENPQRHGEVKGEVAAERSFH